MACFATSDSALTAVAVERAELESHPTQCPAPVRSASKSALAAR
jgi:hypothetical protein